MPATRTSPKPTAITPAQRRDEIVAILPAGLVRLIRASEPPPGTPGDALGGDSGSVLGEFRS